MAVTLIPVFDEQRVAVSGDIIANMLIPANPPTEDEAEAYYIAFSDGSLVLAIYAETPTYHLMVEGAGRVTIDAVIGSLSLNWDVEWINLASNRAGTAFASKEPARLPLLELLNEAA
jgi:hypothetical protein